MRRTHIFPHNTTNSDLESNSDVVCCSPEATRSNCSMEYCDCSVEEQIDCFINENLNRLYIFLSQCVGKSKQIAQCYKK